MNWKKKSDWSKREVNEMVSKIRAGIQETGVNIERAGKKSQKQEQIRRRPPA